MKSLALNTRSESTPSIFASSTFSSSTINPSGSDPTGDLMPIASPEDTPSGNPGAKKSLVPIMVGVLSSVGFLSCGAIIGMFLLRRRRTRKVHNTDQYAVVPPMTPFMLSASSRGESLEGQLPREDNLEPFKSVEDGNVRTVSTPHIVKSNIGPRNEGSGEETVALERKVSEIRQEVARLRQLLVIPHQSPSNNTIPDQAVALSEMREEMQRLRHSVSLQPTDRRNVFDSVSRTTSLPAYEC